jgi:hypothetical protein
MPPGPIAARSVWTVAWSMAGQVVMDDRGSAPAWPKFSDSPITAATDLPAPDEGAFDPDYALTHSVSTADIEVDSSSIEAGIATSPWPYQDLVAMPSSAAQLPAPSLLDIGWPVQQREIADAALEPRPSTAANDSSEPSEPHHARTRHTRLIAVHRHARAHAPAGQHAELLSPMTAMATPAH